MAVKELRILYFQFLIDWDDITYVILNFDASLFLYVPLTTSFEVCYWCLKAFLVIFQARCEPFIRLPIVITKPYSYFTQ